MNLAPQSLLVVGRPTSTAPTPENIFDRLLSLLRESGGASVAYNQVATNHTKMDYHVLHEQVLDFMAEDFHQKWNQMHHSVDVEDGLTKVGTVGSSDCVYHPWSAGLQPQRPPCLVCRPIHKCADQGRVHE